MDRLTFWPDYTGALLWTEGGERVALEDAVHSPALAERAKRWVEIRRRRERAARMVR